jgi:hypothetical protein
MPEAAHLTAPAPLSVLPASHAPQPTAAAAEAPTLDQPRPRSTRSRVTRILVGVAFLALLGVGTAAFLLPSFREGQPVTKRVIPARYQDRPEAREEAPNRGYRIFPYRLRPAAPSKGETGKGTGSRP